MALLAEPGEPQLPPQLVMSGEPMSSSAHLPVDKTLCGRYADGKYYEFHWGGKGLSRTANKNENGITGFATITHTTNTAIMLRAIRRIHLCAKNPCANLNLGTKYDIVGTAIHLRQVPKQSPMLCGESLQRMHMKKRSAETQGASAVKRTFKAVSDDMGARPRGRPSH